MAGIPGYTSSIQRSISAKNVAVKVGGQNRIFVSAFCDEKPPPNWREHLFVVMDGDICFWQALYDPFTHQFFNLRINARA
jgi:hypothetical protein